jgi:hypothetical protein
MPAIGAEKMGFLSLREPIYMNLCLFFEHFSMTKL